MTHPEVTSKRFISRLRAAWRVLFPRAPQAQPFPEITPFHSAAPRVPERRAPQPDERCGFPLHLPYGAHAQVVAGNESTVCVECDAWWRNDDPNPPIDRCEPRRPPGGFNEDHMR